MNAKPNALAIGVSQRDYFSLMLAYYPKDIDENFDVYLFVDNRNGILPDIKDIIKQYNVPVFNRAKIILNSEIFDEYSTKFDLTGEAKTFFGTFGACFKLFVPIYLRESCGVQKVFAIDDDIFIFRDLSPIFDKYTGWAFKKEGLFRIGTSSKNHVVEEFNSIFASSFKLDALNKLSINSGTVMYDIDDRYIEHVKGFVENRYVQHLFHNNPGFTSWTLEQRFQHFNMHLQFRDRPDTRTLSSEEVRLVLCLDKSDSPRQLKAQVPSIVHYAVGAKKPLWLRKFIPGIQWRFPDVTWTPQYELRDILYNEAWQPEAFKIMDKKRNQKSLFQASKIF